jgi:hypothetical protein
MYTLKGTFYKPKTSDIPINPQTLVRIDYRLKLVPSTSSLAVFLSLHLVSIGLSISTRTGPI